jgi:hypothetical protein
MANRSAVVRSGRACLDGHGDWANRSSRRCRREPWTNPRHLRYLDPNADDDWNLYTDEEFDQREARVNVTGASDASGRAETAERRYPPDLGAALAHVPARERTEDPDAEAEYQRGMARRISIEQVKAASKDPDWEPTGERSALTKTSEYRKVARRRDRARQRGVPEWRIQREEYFRLPTRKDLGL